ncbi:phosphoglycerate dehydrogenase [Desulfovibrio sp.]|uniref:phosphoglycerate dehydrogenase n=1 Tax=Desulfovibrio sp. TaxID=885 RepID=UPI0023CD23EF|nr:phosphoglycerate dehydrogenase [Desulfovibrio sp.]MDE7242011.1 phosphoglycerate dehydrogenase [Desulfovibrio sp.]
MKVLVTPRSFGKTDPGLFDRLKDAGLEVIRNETGGILDEAAMKKLIAPCEGVILGVDPMNAAVLDAAPKLRAIAKYGVGLDNIDLSACEARGIRVSRTVGANSDAVADYAFALMLGVARRVAFIDRRCRERDWSKITSIDVYGKTLGVIGLGAIGRRVARRARGFDMRVLASDSVWDEDFAVEQGIERADADRICRECDFITLHCLLNDETRNIIDERRIASMKPTAVLVNTARGGLVDEAALLAALKAGRIWGAGLDVFAHEPPEDPDWYILNNVIMGSHCSSSTAGAVNLMGTMAVDNLLRDLGLPL